jgi:flagellar hook-length control protein FliK
MSTGKIDFMTSQPGAKDSARNNKSEAANNGFFEQIFSSAERDNNKLTRKPAVKRSESSDYDNSRLDQPGKQVDSFRNEDAMSDVEENKENQKQTSDLSDKHSDQEETQINQLDSENNLSNLPAWLMLRLDNMKQAASDQKLQIKGELLNAIDTSGDSTALTDTKAAMTDNEANSIEAAEAETFAGDLFEQGMAQNIEMATADSQEQYNIPAKETRQVDVTNNIAAGESGVEVIDAVAGDTVHAGDTKVDGTKSGLPMMAADDQLIQNGKLSSTVEGEDVSSGVSVDMAEQVSTIPGSDAGQFAGSGSEGDSAQADLGQQASESGLNVERMAYSMNQVPQEVETAQVEQVVILEQEVVLSETDSMGRQLIERINLRELEQAQQLTVRLRPDEFGRLEIRLTRSSEGLIAQLISDTAMTRELLAQQANDLQQALKDQGFDIVQTEILSDFSDQNQNDNNFAAWQQAQEETGSNSRMHVGNMNTYGLEDLSEQQVDNQFSKTREITGQVDYFA